MHYSAEPTKRTTPFCGLCGRRAVQAIVRVRCWVDDARVLLASEDHRKDLNDEHERGLDNVKGGRIPNRNHTGIEHVDCGVEHRARRVPHNLCNLNAECGLVKGSFGILIDPNEYCDERRETGGQSTTKWGFCVLFQGSH